MAAAEVAGELVQLYVYDLSGGMARALSQMLLGRQIEAVYHTSIVVGGMEHFFGGGINVAPAGTTPFGRPMQTIDLGHTQLPEEMRAELLAGLSERYTPEAYSLFHNNCNNFADELAQLLCGRGVPQHITGLPSEVLATPFGQMIAPMLNGLEQQLRGMRQQAYQPSPPAAPGAPAAAGASAAGEDAAQSAAASAPSPAAAQAAAAQTAAGAAGPAAGAPALHAAEVEIDSAVAAGMMREAEASLHGLQLEPGQAAAQAAPSGGAAAASTPEAAPEGAKLEVEQAVQAEFERLVAAGVDEHEAQALALEAVAIQQSLLEQQPASP